jgi:hypothetical protein
MTKRVSSRAVPLEAVILVAELAQRCDQKGWHWDVVLSRAGREGTFRRTWDTPSLLTSDQVLDIGTWVQKSFHDAMVAWGGVQEVLPT